MIKFKKIICATDFSEPSFRAVDYARVLATKLDAELLLVNVVDTVPVSVPPIGGAPVDPTFNVMEYQKHLIEQAGKRLDELIEKNSSPDLVIRGHIAEGMPSKKIAKFAEEVDADMIVIATHGHSGFHRFVFGSVAERVVRTAPCPVLTVGPEDSD